MVAFRDQGWSCRLPESLKGVTCCFDTPDCASGTPREPGTPLDDNEHIGLAVLLRGHADDGNLFALAQRGGGADFEALGTERDGGLMMVQDKRARLVAS